MKCPDCGKRMKKGYFWAEAAVGGVGPKWFEKMSPVPLGGEILARQDSMGNAWIEGHRCEACRTLILRY